jgi:hypothetical protein
MANATNQITEQSAVAHAMEFQNVNFLKTVVKNIVCVFILALVKNNFMKKS